ncbi:MAG: H-NS family nucleoid-associated regulatory protein [Myxococcota bacterium]
MSSRRDGDFAALSMTDLLALRDRVEAEISARREESERSIRQRGGLVERDGPRYRNPANPSETWSGRGPRPDWLEQALAEGAVLADLEIVDDRPVKQPGAA